MNFDPCNRSLKIWKSIRTSTPEMGAHLGVWGFIPLHFPTLLGAWDVTLGLPSWPAPLQALALVVSPRLGLRHITMFKFERTFIELLLIWCTFLSLVLRFLEIVILVIEAMLFNFKLRDIDFLHCIHQILLFLLVDSMISEKQNYVFFSLHYCRLHML